MEMTVEEYRKRMMDAFHNANCEELIALVVSPTEKEFRHLEWLLKTHYKTPKEQYENRLKADMVAMLEEIDLEMSEQSFGIQTESWEVVEKLRKEIIQQKINSLKESTDGME